MLESESENNHTHWAYSLGTSGSITYFQYFYLANPLGSSGSFTYSSVVGIVRSILRLYLISMLSVKLSNCFLHDSTERASNKISEYNLPGLMDVLYGGVGM